MFQCEVLPVTVFWIARYGWYSSGRLPSLKIPKRGRGHRGGSAACMINNTLSEVKQRVGNRAEGIGLW